MERERGSSSAGQGGFCDLIGLSGQNKTEGPDLVFSYTQLATLIYHKTTYTRVAHPHAHPYLRSPPAPSRECEPDPVSGHPRECTSAAKTPQAPPARRITYMGWHSWIINSSLTAPRPR